MKMTNFLAAFAAAFLLLGSGNAYLQETPVDFNRYEDLNALLVSLQ